MILDPTVQVAAIGIITTIVTSGAGLIVAGKNSKKERQDAAENTMESVLRERILLRDEQIRELEEDVKRLTNEVQSLRSATQEQTRAIETQIERQVDG